MDKIKIAKEVHKEMKLDLRQKLHTDIRNPYSDIVDGFNIGLANSGSDIIEDYYPLEYGSRHGGCSLSPYYETDEINEIIHGIYKSGKYPVAIIRVLGSFRSYTDLDQNGYYSSWELSDSWCADGTLKGKETGKRVYLTIFAGYKAGNGSAVKGSLLGSMPVVNYTKYGIVVTGTKRHPEIIVRNEIFYNKTQIVNTQKGKFYGAENQKTEKKSVLRSAYKTIKGANG